MAAQNFVVGAWVRMSFVVYNGFIFHIRDINNVHIASVEIISNGTTFVGTTVTISSFVVRVSRNSGAGTVTHDYVDPYVDPMQSHDYTTYPRSSWTSHVWGFRVKTSSFGASTDGEFELQIDGATILSATGVAIFVGNPGPMTFGFSAAGDMDNIWATATSTFPSVDGSGALTDPGQAMFSYGFDGGDRTGLSDFTAAPAVRSDVGAGGGYGFSRWNAAPSNSVTASGGSIHNSGLSYAAEPLVAIVGSVTFGDTTSVTVTRAVAFGVDGNTNVHDTSGVVKIFGNLEVTGGFDAPASSSFSTYLDGLGT